MPPPITPTTEKRLARLEDMIFSLANLPEYGQELGREDWDMLRAKGQFLHMLYQGNRGAWRNMSHLVTTGLTAAASLLAAHYLPWLVGHAP